MEERGRGPLAFEGCCLLAFVETGVDLCPSPAEAEWVIRRAVPAVRRESSRNESIDDDDERSR